MATDLTLKREVCCGVVPLKFVPAMPPEIRRKLERELGPIANGFAVTMAVHAMVTADGRKVVLSWTLPAEVDPKGESLTKLELDQEAARKLFTALGVVARELGDA